METTSMSKDPDIVEKVALGILMSVLITIAILGNLLVCIAVLTDATLRKLSNLFFVSLALSDLLVASLVMPFAMVNDLTTSFVDWFGQEFCQFWIASDVMLCTASIINLLLISFDRYIHIKDPLQYTRWITRKSVPIAIALTWIVSALISFLPISLDLHMPNDVGSAKSFSLLHSTTQEDTSFKETETVMSAINSSISFDNGDNDNKPVKNSYSHESRKSTSYLSSLPTNDNSVSDTESYSYMVERMDFGDDRVNVVAKVDHEYLNESHGSDQIMSMDTSSTCDLEFSPVYSMTSSFVSFFLPSIVMLTIYFHLYAIAQRHSKSMRESLTLNRASLSSVLSPLQRIRSNRSNEHSNGNTNILRSFSINNKSSSLKTQTRRKTSTKTIGEVDKQQSSPLIDKNITHSNSVKLQPNKSNEPVETTVFLATSDNPRRGSTVVVKTTQIQTPDAQSKISSTNRSRPKNVNFTSNSSDGRVTGYKTEAQTKNIGELLKTVSIQSTIIAPESRSNNNPQLLQEHKAAVTIGIIMGVFLLCWTPFFVVNVVSGFCKDCIPPTAFKVLTWLGWSNSCFNPVIYSIFNKEFRAAFKKIITTGPSSCFRAIAPPCINDKYADDLKKAEKNSRLYRMQNPY